MSEAPLCHSNSIEKNGNSFVTVSKSAFLRFRARARWRRANKATEAADGAKTNRNRATVTQIDGIRLANDDLNSGDAN